MNGISILYFGNDYFAENRTSAHHIARRLAARFPLLYVETPGLRAPQASARDLNKIVAKLHQAAAPPRSLDQRFWHMTVPQIPFRSVPGISGANRLFSAALVRFWCRQLRFENPVSWFTVPHAHGSMGRLGERLSVYYCVDDYAALPGVDAERVREMDLDMSRRAGLIFAVSRHLESQKRPLNPNVVYSPHGVDANLFGRAMSDDAVPEPARSWPRPVIGYFGVLDGRFDVDLLEQLAVRRPDWTFAFVGRAATDLRSLPTLPNIRLQPPVPYETLPDWARAFDVCLMPYRSGAFAQAANPLKLREYLATGRPVVSTPMPEAAPFAQHILLAEGADAFVRQIEVALSEEVAAQRPARLAAVQQITWDARVEEICRTIQLKLECSQATNQV
jgi:glycosyltransferase involved in cell wall biosynthesis